MTIFTPAQVDQLLAPINPRRVLEKQGQSHLSQQDVRAHLTRLFGFGHWNKQVLRLELISFVEADGRFTATYLVHLRLTVWSADLARSWSTEDVATGSAQRQKTPGDAHDLAAKAAVSYALKRCATDLGDQFGLSLYNSGQKAALVKGTLVHPTVESAHQGDVQADVEQQVSLGLDDEGSRAEPATDASPTAQVVRDAVPKVPCKGACGQMHWPTDVRDGFCRPCWVADRAAAAAAVPDAQESASGPSGTAPVPAASVDPVKVPAKAAKKAAAKATRDGGWSDAPVAVIPGSAQAQTEAS